MKRKMFIIAAACALALSVTACGAGSASETEAKTETAEAETTEAETEEETESESEGETLARFPEGEEAPEGEADADSIDNYFTDQPVMMYGSITSIDDESGDFTLNVEGGQETVFHTQSFVPVVDAVSGLPVSMSDLEEGDFVYAWASNAMTMSLPPQTSLQALIVNVPEDAGAPSYVVVTDATYDVDYTGNLEITDQDGNVWSANEDTEVSPFKTRNIVTLDDITEGSRLIIWDNCSKIVIL